MVPAPRLLGWVALLLPFAALGGLAPETAPLAAGLWLLLAGCAAADVYGGLRRLRRIGVRMPDTVRLFQWQEGKIPVRLSAEGAGRVRLRLGLPLPAEMASPVEVLVFDLPGAGAPMRVDWPCCPDTRGRFDIRNSHVEVVSPLGLWGMRGAFPCRTECRVYPAILRERSRLPGLFLHRAAGGVHVRRRIGKGREFDQLRDYVAGDSYEDVHWKATGKRGRPVTKLYRIERTQDVYVAVDGGRLSARRLEEGTVYDRFLASALVLSLAAERNGDRFGLAAFSDRVDRFVRAGSGAAHYAACRDAVYTRNPRLVTPDFGALAAALLTRVPRRSLVIILTDLSDPALGEPFIRGLALAARRHVIVPVSLGNAEARRLFSRADAGETADLYARLAGHLAWRHLRQLTRELRRRGMELTETSVPEMTAHLVARYLDVKNRQVL